MVFGLVVLSWWIHCAMLKRLCCVKYKRTRIPKVGAYFEYPRSIFIFLAPEYRYLS